ncbi:MAG: hypothetical protein HYZ74_07905 [Elusimicrobia bacterium]|nr:hypothetical protein [Elusimicrobiota bacterium]
MTLMFLLGFVSSVLAQTAAPFNFNAAGLRAQDKAALRAYLQAEHCRFAEDGTVLDADGHPLTDSMARSYLADLKRRSASTDLASKERELRQHGAYLLTARKAADGSNVWDGGKPSEAAVAAMPPGTFLPYRENGRLAVYHKARVPKIGPIGHKKWNPVWWLKNDDDYVPPADYRPNGKARKLMWFFRNSCHNWTFYVQGIADKDYTIVGRHPDHVMRPKNGWNWLVLKRKWLRLPFISYTHAFKRKTFRFYLGWRPGGCFGAKFSLQKPDKPSPPAAKTP